MRKSKVYIILLILITILGPAFVIFVHYTKTSVFMNISSEHSGTSTRHYYKFDL